MEKGRRIGWSPTGDLLRARGTCDAHLRHATGAEALEAYSAASDSTVTRFIVASGRIGKDELTAAAFGSGSLGTIRSRARNAVVSG